MPSFPGALVRASTAGLALLAALLAAASPGAATAADTRNRAEERIDGWLAAHESLRARFLQTVFDEAGARLDESRGTVAFRRPYRFRWDYEAPEPQIIVADGENLWWYDADLEQVTVRPVDAALEQGQEVVELGDLGYWPPGRAFCIFFGPTPASRGAEIRPASAVTVIGRVSGDATLFRQVRAGTTVTIEAC